jgi:hypothetical protein
VGFSYIVVLYILGVALIIWCNWRDRLSIQATKSIARLAASNININMQKMWRAIANKIFGNQQNEWDEWLRSQVAAMERGNEIMPPWVMFPGSETWWGGWRQGYSEAWLCEVWLPFWRRLQPPARKMYVQQWNIPEDWRVYLENYQ